MGGRDGTESVAGMARNTHVLVAIVKKQMRLHDLSLYTILQILSVTLFEKEPLFRVLETARYTNMAQPRPNQLELFEY